MSYANMDGVPTQTAGTSEILAADWNTFVRDNFDAIKFGHVVCTSSSRPTGIGEGTMVYESDTNLIYVYNGSAWSQNNLTPVGMISPFAGSSAPDGWLLCHGQAVSQTTYAALFGVIGTTYDVSSPGAGNFRVPDLRGRVVAGVDNMGGVDAGRLDWVNAPGTTGGAQSLPEHTHTMDHNHDAFTTTDGAGAHQHTTTIGHNVITNNSATGSGNAVTGIPGTSGNTNSNAITSTSAGGHNHNIDIPNFTGNTGPTGTGSHGVMQPTMLLNYIIKA